MPVEVPFAPVEIWGIAPAPLWRGRKGHRVLAKVNGIKFAGFIVSRQRKSFLLVEEDIKHEAGIAVGDIVNVTLAPESS